MPAYNFQPQFVPMILDGSKPHTIRRRRKKRPTKVGDVLMLYTGMRTKQCILIALTECVKIEAVMIKPFLEEAWIYELEKPGELYYSEEEEIGSYRLLRREEAQALAIGDGFVNASQFFGFFKRYKTDVLDDFEIIHWDTGDLFMPVNGSPKYGEVKMQLGGDPHRPMGHFPQMRRARAHLGEEDQRPGVCSQGYDMAV